METITAPAPTATKQIPAHLRATYYRMVLHENGQVPKLLYWPLEEHGEPTPANVEQYRQLVNKTYRRGGAQFHECEAAGRLINFWKISVFQRGTGDKVAEAVAPMFEAI